MRLCSRVLVAFLFFAGPAAAQEAPWVGAGVVMRAAGADIQRAGIRGIAAHVPALEQALAGGAAAFPPRPGADGKMTILVDSPAEALGAMVMAANQKIQASTIPNPYGEIGLMLALHYNQANQPQEALRVIAATLALKAIPDAYLGLHHAGLFTEQATSYVRLKRWDDALASSDAALKASQNDRDKARSHRSRGFALIELQRLDDAESAYVESLKLEPNNPIALRELGYIGQQRAGAPRGAPQIFSPGDPPRPPPTPTVRARPPI